MNITKSFDDVAETIQGHIDNGALVMLECFNDNGDCTFHFGEKPYVDTEKVLGEGALDWMVQNIDCHVQHIKVTEAEGVDVHLMKLSRLKPH